MTRDLTLPNKILKVVVGTICMVASLAFARDLKIDVPLIEPWECTQGRCVLLIDPLPYGYAKEVWLLWSDPKGKVMDSRRFIFLPRVWDNHRKSIVLESYKKSRPFNESLYSALLPFKDRLNYVIYEIVDE